MAYPSQVAEKHVFVEAVEASLHLELDSKYIEAIRRAIEPEVRYRPDRFVKCKLSPKKKTLTLHFKADSIPHLRAALNSYLRLIRVAEDVLMISDS